MEPVLMLCVALTLYYVAPAFLAPRRLIPSQSVFLERLIMPAAARRVWYYVLWLLCACGAPPGAVGLWCLVTLLCDRYLCSPHLVHFGLCCAVMTLVSSAHHQRTWFALYASLMYTFAGLQKMNPTFARGFVAGVLSPPLRRWTGLQLEQLLPAVWQLLVGYSVALVECALGLLLVCSYRYAYALIMAMHAFILLSFGPLGRADFHGIYGWNLWCMWLAWCGLGPGALWSDVRELPSLALAAFVGTFGGIPACALLCRVGERLSFKMHSENSLEFAFLMSRADAAAIYSPEFANYMVRAADDRVELLVQDYIRDTAYLMPSLSDRTAASLARCVSRELGVTIECRRAT